MALEPNFQSAKDAGKYEQQREESSNLNNPELT